MTDGFAAGPGTIHGEILAAASRFADRPFQRADGGRRTSTYGEFRGETLCAARGLVACGLRPGDRVAIVAENSPRWLVADVATLAAGGIDVPRGAAAPARDVAAIVAHAACRFAFVEDAAALDRFRGALAGVERVFLFDGEAPQATSWDELLAAGRADTPLPDVAPDSVATIVYTSGTTGDPKGVTLCHRSVVSNVRALADVLPVEPGHVFLSLLPTWHMYERTVEYFAASRGAVVAYTELRRLREDLVAERPHLLVAVPRVWEKIHDGVAQSVRDLPKARRLLASAALRGSLAFTRARLVARGLSADSVDSSAFARAVRAVGLVAWPLHLLARRVVHRRVRAATGGRLVAAVSGGATLPLHVDLFLAAAGVPVLVGYGLTETSPVVAVRRLDRNVVGTVGIPLDGTQVRVASDGGQSAATLRVRGPQVMRGYWNDAAATARVVDADGWFDTGDIVRLTRRGDLVFCGRDKDTIVLTGGENVEPEPIEQAVLASPLVAQIVVVGQDKKTLAALVWPSDEALAKSGRAAALAAVKAEIEARTSPAAGFRPWERVPRVALLPAALSVEDGTLTATLKTRRTEIAARHAALIDSMYASD